VGNRVYTDLGEDGVYFIPRGTDVAAVVNALTVITAANAALKEYATGRRLQLATI